MFKEGLLIHPRWFSWPSDALQSTEVYRWIFNYSILSHIWCNFIFFHNMYSKCFFIGNTVRKHFHCIVFTTSTKFAGSAMYLHKYMLWYWLHKNINKWDENKNAKMFCCNFMSFFDRFYIYWVNRSPWKMEDGAQKSYF